MQTHRSRPSRTQILLNYNTIQERPQHDGYSPRRSVYTPQKHTPFMPLKKFQEYFGKVKPSFFIELKNIFANSTIEERSPSPALEEPLCQVQGGALTSRVRNIRRRREAVSQSNNFRIESMGTKNIYRKAKLNKLLKFSSDFKEEIIDDSKATQILKESSTIVKQIKEVIRQVRRTMTPSPQTPQRSSRMTQSFQRQTLLLHLNPSSKQTFSAADLHRAVAVLHQTKIKVSPNISYFNVYIEEGNNSELLKMLVRRRTGWRVVQIPAIANLIWTQYYRKAVLKKRLNKREKTEVEGEKLVFRQSAFKTGKPPNSKSVEPQALSPLAKPSYSNFTAEIRKLVSRLEAEDISKLKMSLRHLRELTINHNVLVHNHFPLNKCISDKKNLLRHLTAYLSKRGRDVFDYLPESYELSEMSHPIIDLLKEKGEEKEHWIIKPGENSNRGKGIIVTHTATETIEELRNRLEPSSAESPQKRLQAKSVVLQRYIVPFLYNNRKFDVRSYMLVTLINKQLRVYCYEQCYIRTSSKQFDIQSSNRLVHLTNDAIQSQSHDYGKHEEGNKVSETAFSRYIDEEHKKQGGEGSIWKPLKQQMEERCVDIIESSIQTLVLGCEREERSSEEQQFYFQLFGLDFMIDAAFKLWLIEVNTNPAITHDCSKVLNLLIPKMLDNVLSLAVQPIMKPLRLQETAFNNRFTAVLKRTLQ